MDSNYMSIIWIVIMFAAMWFILIRPAQKQRKATMQMQSNLKKGDKVITIGGLHGEVDSIEDTIVYLKIDGNTTVKFERQAIGRIVE